MSENKSMKVLMYYSNKDVRLEEMPVPEISHGEALMRVTASGICGSDVLEWYRRDKVPLVLGHEVAGEIVNVGEGIDKFKQGDRVAATHHVPCNTCYYCLNGYHTVCETLLKGTHFHPGGFAEYIRVPAINVDRGMFLIPDEVSDEEASFMEPLACVLRGQRRAGFNPGRSVLVLGNGIAGLLHIGLARSMGAGLIMAADTIAFRMDKAREIGAHHVFRADDNLVDSIRAINNGYMADLVILCYDGFMPLALKAVEKGGTVLLFTGAAEDTVLSCDYGEIFWRTEITLTSSYAGSPSDCAAALNLIRSGTIPLKQLITSRLPMEKGAEGFKAVANPVEHECVKVVITP
jgi:L-iditol 2-dehydrogenase